MNIRFEKGGLQHQKLIFDWLEKQHMKEFWDNSQEHRDDILNFIHGRQQHYFGGTTKYWVGYFDDQPFCFLLTDELHATQEDLPELYRAHLSKDGHTIALDFGIGETQFLGKGLAAPTLVALTKFYQEKIDSKADTFLLILMKTIPAPATSMRKLHLSGLAPIIRPRALLKDRQVI